MWTPWIVLITYIKTFLCNSSFKLENEAFSILQLHFQNRNLLYLYIYCCNLVDTVESKVVLNGGNLGFVFSLRRESQNTANSHKKQNHFATFLGMKYYVKQAMNDLWTNLSVETLWGNRLWRYAL